MKSSLSVCTADEGLALIQSKVAEITFEEEDEVTKDKIESWLVLKLLERLIEAQEIECPFVLEGADSSGAGHERPDFRVSSGGIQIGIEVTEARHRDHAWALARSSSVAGACVELSHFRPNYEIDRKTGLKPHVVLPGERLTGSGWNGFEAEREWCDYMIQSIQEKHTKLAEGGYHRFDEDWLFISDRTPVSMFIPSYLEIVCQQLLDRFIASYYQREGGFHRIYVRCQTDVVKFNQSGFRILRHGA